MLKYAIQAGKMNEMMELLFRVLDMRITFFDLQECEVEGFNIKEMSPFCRHFRRSPEFDALCVKCDRAHLMRAKRIGNVYVYHCHSGLLEGIVPLHDRHRIYIGAIVFGQLRDRERDYRAGGVQAKRLLTRSRESSRQEMYDVGALLKYLSEYIIEKEIVQYRGKPWAERLDDYIRGHLSERLTLIRLASEIGRSTSFLSHNFPLEFGAPLKDYIRQARMKKARSLIEGGSTVRETASTLGFYDEFHFSKEFKRHFGLPPKTFKTSSAEPTASPTS